MDFWWETETVRLVMFCKIKHFTHILALMAFKVEIKNFNVCEQLPYTITIKEYFDL